MASRELIRWRLRGAPIAHSAIREFSDRNYPCDGARPARTADPCLGQGR
jgi:hypothetical protein